MASERTEFEVVATETGWEVKRDSTDFLSVQTRDVAVDEAVYQATQSQPSHVTVKRLDGSVEEEADFGEVTQAPESAAEQAQAPSAVNDAPLHNGAQEKAAS